MNDEKLNIDTETIMILALKLQDRVKNKIWLDAMHSHPVSRHDLTDLEFVNSIIKELENQ